MAEPILIGVNLDGVLEHDGLPLPTPAERFRMIAGAGVFDYVEKNPSRGEDLSPYFALVERHALPIRVIGGIWCAGRDEAHAAEIVDAGARFGSTVLNCQLYAHHADGHPLSDREVADFYLRTYERGEPVGCLPSLEVHVDMWSEDFTRVARVARHVEQAGAPFRITLDHSHLLFKIGNRAELDASGIRERVDSGSLVLDPASPAAIYADWIARGWVRHAHARSVIPNNPENRWMRRADGRPGRGIQYPFVAPAPGAWHGEWHAAALDTWKAALRQLLQSQAHARSARLEQISCEFIPFPDYGGSARYSIFDNNVACAHWLRDTWHALTAPPTDAPADTTARDLTRFSPRPYSTHKDRTMTQAFHFSLNRMSAPRLPLDRYVALCRRLGIDTIEIRNDLDGVEIADGTPAAVVRATAEAGGVTILTINALQRFEQWNAERADEATVLADYAAQCGARALVLCPTNSRGDTRGADARHADLVKALKALKPILEARGLLGFIEPLGFDECALRRKSDAVKGIYDAAGEQVFRLVHDTFHHHLSGEDIFFPNLTGLVHISGVDEADLPVDRMRDGHRVLVGGADRLGNIRQLRELLARGYRGAFSFEPFANEIAEADDIEDRLRASIDYVRRELADC